MTGDKAGIDQAYISWRGEIARKGIHLCSLSIPLGYYIFNAKFIIIALFAAFTISGLIDLLRFFGNDTVKKYLKLAFGFMLRPRESKSFSGATTILFAALLVYLFYDLPVAAAAMAIIVMGDTAAAVVGRSIGKIRLINSKSLEGTMAFIVFAFIVVLWIPNLSMPIALAGVVVGSIIELLPIPIDDNITVPLIAGGVMQLLLAYPLY
jgi:dolichol kinase